MYARDNNSKQVMIETITTDRRGFHFKDDNQETDVSKHLEKMYDIVWYIEYLDPDYLT